MTPIPLPRLLTSVLLFSIMHGGGSSHLRAHARDKHEKEQFDVMLLRRQYPTVPATSRSGISACFDGDIRYVLIDVSLFRRGVATSGRGCRPQRVNFLRNKLMCGHNALASTASPNAPITALFACSHLIQYGQHPKQYDEMESCGSAANFY
jgi:hypothetical protein